MSRAVLDRVDLHLAPGTTTSITGRNGVGKTTLLRIVAGLITGDAGRIELHGHDPERHRLEYQQCVGLLSAGDGGLYGRLTVEDHLRFWAGLYLLERRERSDAISRCQAAFELDDLRHRRADRLSMGQRQRLRMAQAFLHDPVLVLLDEPHTSLDAEGLAVLARALTELTRRGGAAVICWPAPPDDDSGQLIFDRTLALADGQLMETRR